VKLSVSLPGADVEFLDAYAQAQGLDSRSAAVQRAVHLLRAAELRAAYASAWDEWTEDPDSAAWEPATADGLADGGKA
jgi:Arc/MetJ-type ribon-helix-helix transcriptional regulator